MLLGLTLEEEKLNLAGFIRQRLDEMNMQQKELAKKAGISEGQLSEVINGKENPGVRFFKRVAPILGVTPDYLFSLTLKD